MSGSGSRERWRGKLPIPEHVHPMVRRLFELMNLQQTTMSEIARRAGMRRGTISDWRYRRNPGLTELAAAFNALGYELAARPAKGEVL